MPSTASRYARNAALIGLCIAVALEVWRQIAMARAVGEAQEGVWLAAAVFATAAGAPLNLPVVLLLGPVAVLLHQVGIDPFYLLHAGLVANWAMIGWAIGGTRDGSADAAWERVRAPAGTRSGSGTATPW